MAEEGAAVQGRASSALCDRVSSTAARPACRNQPVEKAAIAADNRRFGVFGFVRSPTTFAEPPAECRISAKPLNRLGERCRTAAWLSWERHQQSANLVADQLGRSIASGSDDRDSGHPSLDNDIAERFMQ